MKRFHSTLVILAILLALTSCNQPIPAPTSVPTLTLEPNLPLKDALSDLQPQDVFQNFYDITQVPRPSGYMDEIRPFLVDFGKGLGLETIVDDAGNVIIRKPGAPGLEDQPGVILQAHMDMVAQKSPDVTFEFKTDPIQAFVNGNYLVTDGTTLGADDGMGMAMIMAILQSKNSPGWSNRGAVHRRRRKHNVWGKRIETRRIEWANIDQSGLGNRGQLRHWRSRR